MTTGRRQTRRLSLRRPSTMYVPATPPLQTSMCQARLRLQTTGALFSDSPRGAQRDHPNLKRWRTVGRAAHGRRRRPDGCVVCWTCVSVCDCVRVCVCVRLLSVAWRGQGRGALPTLRGPHKQLRRDSTLRSPHPSTVDGAGVVPTRSDA